jgi:hypothetical protein
MGFQGGIAWKESGEVGLGELGHWGKKCVCVGGEEQEGGLHKRWICSL